MRAVIEVKDVRRVTPQALNLNRKRICSSGVENKLHGERLPELKLKDWAAVHWKQTITREDKLAWKPT